jgi:hypothetical protein
MRSKMIGRDQRDAAFARAQAILRPEVVPYASVTIVKADGTEVVVGEQISCGCCRGPIGDRCCCWNHRDEPRGIFVKTCTRHGAGR